MLSGAVIVLRLLPLMLLPFFLTKNGPEAGIFIVSIATSEGLMVIQSLQPMTTVTLVAGRQLIEPLYSDLRLIRISGDNQVSPEWETLTCSDPCQGDLMPTNIGLI